MVILTFIKPSGEELASYDTSEKNDYNVMKSPITRLKRSLAVIVNMAAFQLDIIYGHDILNHRKNLVYYGIDQDTTFVVVFNMHCGEELEDEGITMRIRFHPGDVLQISQYYVKVYVHWDIDMLIKIYEHEMDDWITDKSKFDYSVYNHCGLPTWTPPLSDELPIVYALNIGKDDSGDYTIMLHGNLFEKKLRRF